MSKQSGGEADIGTKRHLPTSQVEVGAHNTQNDSTASQAETADGVKRVRRSRWQIPVSAESTSGGQKQSNASSERLSTENLATITPTLGSIHESGTSAETAQFAETLLSAAPVSSTVKPLPAANALAEMKAKLAKAKELAMAKFANLKKVGTAAATDGSVVDATSTDSQSEKKAYTEQETASKTESVVDDRAGTTQLSLAERLKQQIESERETRARFTDKSIKMPGPERRRREIVFLEPGTFQRRAEALRAKQLMQEARRKRYVREVSAREATLTVDFKLLAGGTSTSSGVLEGIEWWDRPLFGIGSDSDSNTTYDALVDSTVATDSDMNDTSKGAARFKIDESKITSLIHHPRVILPAIIEPVEAPKAAMLTKEESKKKRKRERAERIKEQHDWIRAGLIPPPPPKMRLSTLMHTMGDALISDPTGVVAKAKAQMEERIRKHEEANLARALTPEQRRHKRYLKRMEDTSFRVCVAVYRAGDLSEYIRRDRIQRQAKRYQLTGIAVLHPDCNLLVFEGGPKALDKVHKYLTRSIRWTQKSGTGKDGHVSDDSDEEDEEDEDEDVETDGDAQGSHKLNSKFGRGFESQLGKTTHKTCELVWRGELAKRNFDNFAFETGSTYHSARQIVERHGVPHYWDAGLTYSVPRVL